MRLLTLQCQILRIDGHLFIQLIELRNLVIRQQVSQVAEYQISADHPEFQRYLTADTLLCYLLEVWT